MVLESACLASRSFRLISSHLTISTKTLRLEQGWGFGRPWRAIMHKTSTQFSTDAYDDHYLIFLTWSSPGLQGPAKSPSLHYHGVRLKTRISRTPTRARVARILPSRWFQANRFSHRRTEERHNPASSAPGSMACRSETLVCSLFNNLMVDGQTFMARSAR